MVEVIDLKYIGFAYVMNLRMPQSCQFGQVVDVIEFKVIRFSHARPNLVVDDSLFVLWVHQPMQIELGFIPIVNCTTKLVKEIQVYIQ